MLDNPGPDLEWVDWSDLPDLVLEKIFNALSMRDRYRASLACRTWYSTFYSPRIWRLLRFDGRIFMHRRYTLHRGYWDELSHYKVLRFLVQVGGFVRKVVVEPVPDYYSLYEFLNIWSQHLEYCADQGLAYPMTSLTEFDFAFACELRGAAGPAVHGTGGKLLQALRRLLRSLRGLHSLGLSQLLLDAGEAEREGADGGVLGDALLHCGESLRRLELRNYTSAACPQLVAALFPYLRTLVISPQHLGGDVVAMLPAIALADLVIVQDEHTPHAAAMPVVAATTWREVQAMAPHLRVHIITEGRCRQEPLFPQQAPVTSVVYVTPFMKACEVSVLTIVELYGHHLITYGHYGLPRLHGSRAFSERPDSALLALVRHCPRLRTLAVRDRISTGTLLLIANEAKNLKQLFVRRNALLKKMDWPKPYTWSEAKYEQLRTCAKDYDKSAHEVSRLIGYFWQPLSDKQFKSIQPSYEAQMD